VLPFALAVNDKNHRNSLSSIEILKQKPQNALPRIIHKIFIINYLCIYYWKTKSAKVGQIKVF